MEDPVPILTISATLDGSECKKNKNDKEFEKENEKRNYGKFVLCCFGRDKTVDEAKKPTQKLFTPKQKLALIMLATADFMSFCSMSIMAPFYPKEAAIRGVSDTMSGFVFGYYALVVFLSSPIFGKIMPKFGVKLVFILGLLISGISSILFGALNNIEDYNLFIWMSFIIRGFEALGAGAYSTAGYVIIINIFPNHAATVRGLLETFVGLGMSAGPGIGGLLFAIGGFGLPFYVIGSIIMLMAILNMYLLPSPESCKLEKGGSFTNLLKLSSVVMTCLIIVVVSMTWGFLDPTLEPHLRKFDLTPGKIGLIFLLLSAMYGIFCPAWGWLTDKIDNYWWLMTTGLFLNSFILLLLGPSPILNFVQDSIWLNIISLSALGISVAMSLMPTFQFIVDTSIQNEFPDNLGTHSVIAGLWSSAYSLGEVLGPILGGTIMEHYGFAITSTSFAICNFVLAFIGTLYFINRKTTMEKSSVLPISADLDAACYSQNISEFPSISIARSSCIKPEYYCVQRVS